MRAIVLVKQVPDLRGAPIGVRPDGTIDRQAAAAVTNPADLHALEAALSVAAEVWVLSMGPPTSPSVGSRLVSGLELAPSAVWWEEAVGDCGGFDPVRHIEFAQDV